MSFFLSSPVHRHFHPTQLPRELQSTEAVSSPAVLQPHGLLFIYVVGSRGVTRTLRGGVSSMLAFAMGRMICPHVQPIMYSLVILSLNAH
jgi:hypothetical protein